MMYKVQAKHHERWLWIMRKRKNQYINAIHQKHQANDHISENDPDIKLLAKPNN